MRRSGFCHLWEVSFLVAVLVVSVPSMAGPVDGTIPGPVPARIIIVKARIWLDQEVETRVRLDGVDAPELRGKCAQETRLASQARDFIAGLGGGSGAEVLLLGIDYGKFARRVVARVETLDGVDYSTALIETGLGRPYDGRRRRSWC
jgi:endonuclease YncB( thermonuclease family)